MMKITFTALFILFIFYANAQSVCGNANEGGDVTLTAPSGFVFNTITFASYGTPNGTCGSFTIGGCHATNSRSIAESIFIGQNSASLSATNGVFGDPCSGTGKRLYVEATYTNVLPVVLQYFQIKAISNGEVSLSWATSFVFNASHFEIERSTDGQRYMPQTRVKANGSSAGSYLFEDKKIPASTVLYYRLKMVDNDGSFSYSEIKTIKTQARILDLKAIVRGGNLLISSTKSEEAVVINSNGQFVKRVRLIAGITQMDISSMATGIYVLKAGAIVNRFVKL